MTSGNRTSRGLAIFGFILTATTSGVTGFMVMSGQWKWYVWPFAFGCALAFIAITPECYYRVMTWRTGQRIRRLNRRWGKR